MRSAEQRLLNAVQRPEAYREVVLGSAGGRIVLSVWDGATGMPVVLFLPGTMTHPLFYEEFLDALNRSGLTVAGLHGQGHGKSPRSRRPLTFACLVTNARDAVTWIRQTLPGRPLAVIGSSQGSVLAMALAADDHRIDVVFAHNILDPALASTIQITRFPRGLARAYPAVLAAFRAGARIAPAVPVPFGAYLDIRRVCRDQATAEYFYTDPLGRRSYPLRFLASLFTADLAGMRDGSITCPVTVIAGRGDPLFPLAYIREVYDRIVAQRKDLLILDPMRTCCSTKTSPPCCRPCWSGSGWWRPQRKEHRHDHNILTMVAAVGRPRGPAHRPALPVAAGLAVRPPVRRAHPRGPP